MFYHKHKSFDRYIYLRALYNKNLLFKNYDLNMFCSDQKIQLTFRSNIDSIVNNSHKLFY